MKKLIIVVLCFMGFYQLDAQEINDTINKYILGGSFSYQYQKNSARIFNNFIVFPDIDPVLSNNAQKSNYHNLFFSPYFGREINKNWTLGVLLRLRSSTYKEEYLVALFTEERTITTREVGGGIFARYHFTPQKKFNIFLQPFIVYQSLKGKQKRGIETTYENKAAYLELGVTPGMMYNFSDRFQATLRYGGISFLSGNSELENFNVNENTTRDFSSFNTNFSLSNFFIGVEFRL